MPKNSIAIPVFFLLICLAACGGVEDSTGQFQASDPRPGAALYGIIEMGTRETRPNLSILVSSDGSELMVFTFNFLDLDVNPDFLSKNEGKVLECTASYSFTFPSATEIPVKDGTFSVDNLRFGGISGTFDSPISASGVIRLYQPTGLDCGIWGWQAEEE
jgi:hypothetical protein